MYSRNIYSEEPITGCLISGPNALIVDTVINRVIDQIEVEKN